MHKIAILGANGFIGKNLTYKLSTDPNVSIVAFDRFSDYQHSDTHPFQDLPNVTMAVGDFSNREDIDQALNGVDYVFHLVTSTTPATSNNDPFIDIDVNVRSTISLLEACVKNNVKRVLFPSSGGTVYGNIDTETITEEANPQPYSPYGIGKLTIEHFLRYFKHTSNLDYIVYRIANPYGPGQNIHGNQGVIPIFMNSALHQQDITIFGDGSMTRDYVYIDDLVNMLTSSYNQNHRFNEYNLGSGQGKTINQIVQAIELCSNTSITTTHKEVPQTFIPRSVLDTKRFNNEFNIVAETDFQEGIRRTWEYVKKISK